ncbi:ATP synthase F0 subunit C [bacterium]|nr:ATP synthase F0 subunit C [bacterium]
MNKRVVAVLVLVFVIGIASAAFAQEAGLDNEAKKFVALAAGLCIAIAAFGGALGQGRAATAALEGIARNPSAYQQLFTPMILSLALIESLVIYALVISFLLVFKV